MTITIGNGVEIGCTDFGDTKPADYPAFLEEGTCADTGIYGGWWDFITMSLVISGCTVPAEETSWGSVKAIYAE